MALLSKTVKELGKEGLVTRKTIEKLSPADFAFLVDFLHIINHQVLKSLPLKCGVCHGSYTGAFALLGEA